LDLLRTLEVDHVVVCEWAAEFDTGLHVQGRIDCHRVLDNACVEFTDVVE